MRYQALLALLALVPAVAAREPAVRVLWENTSQWSYRSGTGPLNPILFAISPNGWVYHASTLYTGHNLPPAMYARGFDPDGALSWAQTYTGISESDEDEAIDLATDARGNVVLTGRNDGDWATIKYAADGEVLWIRRLGQGAESDWPYDMAIDRSGSIVVGGFIGDTDATPQTPHLVKYSPSGDTLWSVNIPVEPNASARVERVAVDGQDNVYAGIAQLLLRRNHTQWDVVIDKHSPNGAWLWRRQRANPSLSEYLSGFVVDSAGNLFIHGETYDFPLYTWFEKYSPDGELLWSQEFIGTRFNETVLAMDEARTRLYVLGGTDEAPLTLMQVDAVTGEWGWRAQVPIPPPPTGAIGGIAIDSHGNLIVIGRTIKGRRYWAEDIRFTLTKFTPEGRELWTYVHPTNWRRPGPWSLKIDAEDNIYVWGIEVAKLQMLPVRSEGDLNDDRVVDDADLLAVLANQGTGDFAGDVNEDGVVDSADLEIVLEYYGMGAKE